MHMIIITDIPIMRQNAIKMPSFQESYRKSTPLKTILIIADCGSKSKKWIKTSKFYLKTGKSTKISQNRPK